MNVPGYIVYGNDHGKTAISCPREVGHFRRSWVDHERCTASIVGSTMLLSVFMTLSGRDEEDHIKALVTVRDTLTEAGRREPKISLLAGNLNIEFRLDNANVDLHSLDSI